MRDLIEPLTGRAAPAPKDSADRLQLAVAALLIEAARMDGKFDAVERGTIERLLTERFHLEPQAVQSLIEEGRRMVECSVQYFPFTHEICTRLGLEERIEIIQMLWTVAYADGVLDPEEDAGTADRRPDPRARQGAGLGAPASACEIIEG